MKLKASAFLATFVLTTSVGCSSTALNGSGKTKNTKSDKDGGGAGDTESPDDEPDTDKLDKAPDESISGSDDSEDPGAVDVTDDHLTEDGLIEEECFEAVKSFGGTSVEPKERFNWHPEGADAAYGEMLSTPMLMRMSKGAAPMLIAVGTTATNIDSSKLFAIDGKTGTTVWSFATPVAYTIDPAVADVDGDGEADVVIVGSDLFAYAVKGTSGVQIWKSPTAVTAGGRASNWWWAAAPAIADVDADGEPDVVIFNNVYSGKTGKLKYSFSTADAPDWMIVGDVNDAKGIELISSDGIYSGQDGSKICQFATPIGFQGYARLHKGDAFQTIVGSSGNLQGFPGGTTANNLIGYKGTDCSQVFSVAHADPGGGPVNLADLDGDGVLEIATAEYRKYSTYRADGALFWQVDAYDDSRATGSTAFDFNGDGKTEVVYQDEDRLRVFDGSTGNTLFETASSSGTHSEYPIVADVDGDGHAEIVVATNKVRRRSPQQNGLRVFQAPDNDWIGTRTVWNQEGYNVTNVSGGGKVTGFDPKKIWSKRIKSEHLIGYRNNLPMRPIKKECLGQ